jgi:hypothetical protein
MRNFHLNLPKLKNIRPSGTGESPLANAHDWLFVTKKVTSITEEIQIQCHNLQEVHGILSDIF